MADVLKMVIGATAKSAKKEIDSTAKSLSGLDAAASKIAKVGFAVMATAGVAVTAAIVGIAKSAVTLSSDLNQVAKEARQVGAAIEELDTAQGVLDLMTSGSVRAGRAFQDLQRNLADARDGRTSIFFIKPDAKSADIERAFPAGPCQDEVVEFGAEPGIASLQQVFRIRQQELDRHRPLGQTPGGPCDQKPEQDQGTQQDFEANDRRSADHFLLIICGSHAP